MVDGVELVVRHQPQQVRELHRDHAVGLRAGSSARDEVVQVGHVREHVVAEQQVGAAPVRRASAVAVSVPKNRTSVGMPLLLGDRGDVGGRLDAQHRDRLRREVLQQVAVVARDLDDLARRDPGRSRAIISSA